MVDTSAGGDGDGVVVCRVNEGGLSFNLPAGW